LVRLCNRGLKSKKRAAVFAAVGGLVFKVDKLRVVHPTNGRHRGYPGYSLLPQVGRKGLDGASKLDQEVWDQVHAEWEGLL
jgi:hypothetical protein